MVHDQPQFVAEIAQYVERGLQRACHIAERGLGGVLAQMREKPAAVLDGGVETLAVVRA